MIPDYCEGCNQQFAPIDQQSCWGCKDGDCNTSKGRRMEKTPNYRTFVVVGGGRGGGKTLNDLVNAHKRSYQLESTISQVSKALCGKENATPDELLKAADQAKMIIKAYSEGRLAIIRRGVHWPCSPKEAAFRIRNHNYIHRRSEGHASIITDLLEIAADALGSVQLPNKD